MARSDLPPSPPPVPAELLPLYVSPADWTTEQRDAAFRRIAERAAWPDPKHLAHPHCGPGVRLRRLMAQARQQSE